MANHMKNTETSDTEHEYECSKNGGPNGTGATSKRIHRAKDGGARAITS